MKLEIVEAIAHKRSNGSRGVEREKYRLQDWDGGKKGDRGPVQIKQDRRTSPLFPKFKNANQVSGWIV